MSIAGIPKKPFVLTQATILATAIMAAIFALVVITVPARAAEPGWSGCGLGIHGGVGALSGDMGAGSSTVYGQTLGGSVLCDVQMGSIVAGGFVEYDRLFGAAFNQGVKTDMTMGARGGVLIQPTTLLYVHGGRAWYETSIAGTFQGWKLGAGGEIRLPTTAPMFMDIRYTHHFVDDQSDLSADSVRVGLTLKFGAALAPLSGAPLK